MFDSSFTDHVSDVLDWWESQTAIWSNDDVFVTPVTLQAIICINPRYIKWKKNKQIYSNILCIYLHELLVWRNYIIEKSRWYWRRSECPLLIGTANTPRKLQPLVSDQLLQVSSVAIIITQIQFTVTRVIFVRIRLTFGPPHRFYNMEFDHEHHRRDNDSGQRSFRYIRKIRREKLQRYQHNNTCVSANIFVLNSILVIW